ncbi:MAG: ABC transporter ATP-binding protein [Bdellovibrionaceae bacterium]|nr:ABC transporter ATP-binding protein [Pseudobdellovibrionaceae bacterium]NUM59967.1 ABC transporter ATP-binding protein [Pseudobdellovibrionaceae bacterium]
MSEAILSNETKGLINKNVIIEAKNLSVAFEAHTVLKNVDLFVEKGETLVLIGPSGQGKTVLLKTLAGLIEPTAGTLSLYHKQWRGLPENEKIKILDKMGMLFQKNALFDSLSCGENIAFPLREKTQKSELEIQEIVDYFLESVGIIHAKNLYPEEISGGMQKRLGIARALALMPELIFYDDPTAGLDPITSKKIIELILELKKKNNATVIAITNDMNRAYQMADRIAMVYQQNLIITGNVEETKKHSNPAVHQFIKGELLGPLNSSFENL